MIKLTPKQELFAQEYVKTGNASEAYRIAYPKSKNWKDEAVNVQASILLSNSKVLVRVNELKKELAKKHDITKDKILTHLCKIAFLDINSLTDENGNIKNINDLDEDTRKALQGAELKTLGSGDFATTTISYKLSDKLKAIEMINKMLGFNEPDKIDHSGMIETKITKEIVKDTLDKFEDEY